MDGDIMSKAKDIILFSGGMDSTYLLWRYLKDNRPVHVHHVSLRNRTEAMWQPQDAAAARILVRLQKEFTFGYTESKHEWFCTKPIAFDSDVLLLHLQCLVKSFKGYELTLNLGWTHEGMVRPIIKRRLARNATGGLWTALRNSLNNPSYVPKELTFPLLEWGTDRRDMIRDLPQNLLDLTWSCRRPDNGKPCGKCVPCKQIKRALKGDI